MSETGSNPNEESDDELNLSDELEWESEYSLEEELENMQDQENSDAEVPGAGLAFLMEDFVDEYDEDPDYQPPPRRRRIGGQPGEIAADGGSPTANLAIYREGGHLERTQFAFNNDGSDAENEDDDVETVSDSGSDSTTRSSWESRRLVRRNAIVLRDDEDDNDSDVVMLPLPAPSVEDRSSRLNSVEPVEETIQDVVRNVVGSEAFGGEEGAASNNPVEQEVEVVGIGNVLQGSAMSEYQEGAEIMSSDVAVNTSTVSNDDEEGMTCIICYEPYTNSGEHRLACIKCGHTFGKVCIEKWIKTESRCPQCNAKAHRKDIRIIYVKNLRALDTAERDRAMSDLEKERMEKRKMELECAKLRIKFQEKEESYQRVAAEYQLLKNRIGSLYRHEGDNITNELSQPLPGPSHTNGAKYGFHYTKLRDLDLQSECRVGEFNPWLNMMVVSQSIKTPLFPQGAHGIRRINLLDLKASQTTQLHQKEIRDLAFSTNQSDILLSVGMDKKAILTNCNSNVTIQTYQAEYPLWSCVWNELNQYVFYIGAANGSITSYDIRKPNEVLKTVTMPSDEDRSPIARLLFINPSYANLENKFSLCGLLVQRLNSLWFWELRRDTDASAERFHQLPVEGPFLSVDFEPVSRHLLVSTRASQNKGEGKHMVCELVQYYSEGQGANTCSCNIVHSYPNQVNLSKMSRTSIYSIERQTPGTSTGANAQNFSNVLVAANGPQNTAKIWSISDATWKQSIGLTEPVLDFVPCSVNLTHLLGMITSSRVHFYKDSKEG